MHKDAVPTLRAWMQRTGGSQIFTNCLSPAVSLPDLCGFGRLDGSCDAMAYDYCLPEVLIDVRS